MQDSTQRYDWEARQRWIDEQICQWSGEHDAEQFRHSETAQASTALANAALDYAEREGASRPKYYLNKAANVISEIRDAVDLNITGGDKHKMMRLWSHRRFLDDLARKKFPIIGREEVERAVDEYLALPYRSAFIDRLLVDLLVAQELYAYADLNVNAVSVPGFFASSTLKRRPILEWFVDNILNVLGAYLCSLGFMAVFPERWWETANVILAILVIIGITGSTITLPLRWIAVNDAKKFVWRLLEKMNGVYSELLSSGPISSGHVARLAFSASEKGVAWPPPLFVLLEDITRRGGKL